MADPRVLIVSALRNEGPYLIDWLAHLIGAGAGAFVLYSNECDDGTDEMLDLLATAGVITHRRHAPPRDVSIQWHAFRDAWKSDIRKQNDWALVCDVDEYINIRCGDHRFADLIAALPEGTDAVALRWRLFGAAGHAQADPAPVSVRFTRTARPGLCWPLAARLGKTLMRIAGPFNQFGIHRPSQKKGAIPRWCDGSGRPLPGYAAAPGRLALPVQAGDDLAGLNHYSLRSAEEFIVKRDRGLPNRRDRALDLGYWVERNFNTVEDLSIKAMAPATEAARAQLMALPGLADLHARALAWHRDAFARLIRDEATYNIYMQAVLAGDSKDLPLHEAARLGRLYPGR